ncbi:MAG TPA: ATP-binding protein, partial [Rhodothermia bacterium]
YRSIAGDPLSLRQPSVYGIYQSKDGIIWVGNVGSEGWGLTAIDRANNRVTHYVHDDRDPTSRSAGPVQAILEDSRGTLWVGSGNGLDRLNRSTGRFDHFRVAENDPNSIADNRVNVLFEDHGRSLWVGTGGGVSRMSLDRPGYFTNFDIDPDDPNTLSGSRNQAITEDLAGFIWVAMTGGLNRLDPKSGRVTRYLSDPNDPSGLAAPLVSYVHERSREPGIIWCTTYGGGLNRLDVSTGLFRHYSVREGLANNGAYGFVEDDEGRFWISTNRGLSRFDPDTETFRNYGVDIGLQGLEFNSYAFHKGPFGEMFFGGTNGLNSFYPNELSENNQVPQVTLVDLKLFNESVTKSDVVPLNHSLAETDEVVLSHKQNDITFDFIAFHYADPERNEYAYKLEGWNDDWVYVENQRTASFTNLDPGTYTFRVKASNSDGKWNEEGASIRIVVEPPFWATWWFRIFAVLAFAGILVGGYRLRVEQLASRARELETEVNSRTAELKASNNQLEQSHTIVQAINQETSFRRLLTKILEESRVIPGVEKATALVHMPDDDRFHVRASSGWDVDAMQNIALTASEAHRRYVEQAERVAEDIYVAKDVTGRAGTEQMAEFGQVASFLVLRIRVEEKVVAYLVFDNLTDEDAFQQRDIELLERLRDHITSAFIKTRILDDLQTTLTSLQSTQDRLIQSEKMASLGQLTAGIAHEIKNPLNFVNNFSDVTSELADELSGELELAKKELSPERAAEFESLISNLKANARKIAEHGRRADAIVQNMLEHSKVGEGERTPTNLNELLNEYVTLAVHGLEARGGGFKVNVIREFDDAVGQVDLVPQDMGRVFMNLLSNAFDALKEHGAPSGSPTVTVRTAQVGSTVEVQVGDNGPGIPPKVKARIFEPFFTTKPTGSGTGLGLSMSYDIVTKGHGGTLDVISEEGKGATFIVRLPV